MKYYKDNKTGEVFAYESEEERKQFGNSDLKLMTKEETHSHLNPKPTTEQLTAIGREERDAGLSVLDVFVSNPLRYAELSTTQQKEANDYRQALLDIPQQESFPKSYTMPDVPSWLQ